MAKVRIGISTYFELENELVGIGTDSPTNTLQALGNIQSSDAKAIGITTLTTYQGFTDTKLSLQGSGGSKQGTTSGEVIVEGTVNVSSGTTYTSGPESLTATDNFTLPGISDDKPSAGTMRFNKNLGSLEFYTGVEWKAVNSRVDMGNAGRAIISSGYNASTVYAGKYDYITIHTLGNSVYFGDMITAVREKMGCGSETRALFGGGVINPAHKDEIDYLTIASEGNGIDFGNLVAATNHHTALSSSTRGIFAGGYAPNDSTFTNVIQYVEIMTTGNAVDFGDLPTVKESTVGMASPTRGIIGTGMLGGTTTTTTEYLTIASKGNAVVFGDADAIRGLGAAANTTRGLFAGGKGPDQQNLNLIYKITIASTGSQTEFGTLATGARKPDGVSNSTRACFAGGENAPGGRITAIQSVNFSSGGNTEFFGDLAVARQAGNCNSDSHGGLGGY